jgi:hypothetical protein
MKINEMRMYQLGYLQAVVLHIRKNYREEFEFCQYLINEIHGSKSTDKTVKNIVSLKIRQGKALLKLLALEKKQDKKLLNYLLFRKKQDIKPDKKQVLSQLRILFSDLVEIVRKDTWDKDLENYNDNIRFLEVLGLGAEILYSLKLYAWSRELSQKVIATQFSNRRNSPFPVSLYGVWTTNIKSRIHTGFDNAIVIADVKHQKSVMTKYEGLQTYKLELLENTIENLRILLSLRFDMRIWLELQYSLLQRELVLSVTFLSISLW